MSERHVAPFTRYTSIFTILLLSFATAHAEVRLQANPATLSWDWAGSTWQGAVLTVTGPDGTAIRTRADGNVPVMLNLVQSDGSPLRDGAYTWELRLQPFVSASLQEHMSLRRNEPLPADLEAEVRAIRDQALWSGAFAVSKGAFVAPVKGITEPEQQRAGLIPVDNSLRGNATRDQVILDDLIVDGSICVGMDCVNGENFGFDTLRLKENNLRIKFDDTSSTSSFARNDWQLTANDTSNGGAEKFSIDDITNGRTPFTVEAAAPSNSLFVDSGGELGLGTATPVVEIHSVDGNTPTLRLEQDGSSGFESQTWDVAGNEANFFIRDVTNGSALPFRIFPGDTGNALSINANGSVGVNTLTSDNPSNPAAFEVTKTPAGGNAVVVEGGALAVQRTDGGFANIRFAVGNPDITQSYLFMLNSNNGSWILRNETTGRGVLIVSADAPANSLHANATGVGIQTGNPQGALDVNGTIFQRGSQLHADYVFEEDYVLESVEEHAKRMWADKHLPALPGRRVDEDGREVVEIGARSRGMLEELEKAHIYIEQLNNRIGEQNDIIEQFSSQMNSLRADIEALREND